MTNTVKNIQIGSTSYPVQDTKATQFLSSADEATLLSNGTYRGETVANNTIFADSDGVLKKFTKTVATKNWITGTAQTRIGRTNLSIHDQVSAQNGNYVVTSLYYGDARRSTDRGATWVSAGSSSYNASGTSCTVYVQKTGKFYCGTSVGLLATDGTASFSRVGSSTSSVTTYVTDGNVLCCFGGCYTFDNEGTPTWTAANYSVVAARYDSVSGVFYGQRQNTNGYYESTDGYTWTLIGSPGQYFNWVAKHGNVVVGFRRNGSSNTKRYVSTDGGATWTSEAFADQEWFGGVYNGLFYMGRTGGAADFMISTDGLTWTQMNRPDTASAQALVMVDDKVYMGNYAYYFTTGIDYTYALTPLSYTKSEVDTALASKQGTLTAGSGISIASNVISTPAMTGADGTSAGILGAVPAPAATDNTKFLRGDGTWAEAGGGGSVSYKGVNTQSMAGTTDPTSSTEASIGTLYVNTTTSTPFICVNNTMTPNYTLNTVSTGYATVTDGILTASSGWAAVSIPQIPSNSTISYVTKVKIKSSAASLTSGRNLLNIGDNSNNSFGLYLLSSGVFALSSQVNGSWNQHNSTVAPTVGSYMWLAFSIDSNGSVTSSVSLDGESWQQLCSPFTFSSASGYITYVVGDMGNIESGWEVDTDLNKTHLYINGIEEKLYNISNVSWSELHDSSVVQTLPVSPTTGKIYFVTGSTT